MSDATVAPCRHRVRDTAESSFRCRSPKLVGLGLVDLAVCESCYCRNHALEGPENGTPPRLYGCAYLGSPQAEDAGGTHVCRHPDHRTTTASFCRTCPDYLFPILTPWTAAADVRRLLDQPPVEQPHGWWQWPQVQDGYAAAANEFLRDLEPYPVDRFRGRGVVILGGGRYFPSVYVTVRALRHVGCELPIRVYFFGGAGEMPLAWQELLAPYGVHCTDLDDPSTAFAYPEGFEPPCPTERGWTAKVRAILDSPFEEVLLLDADCYPCRDPGRLFDEPVYRETGALFWHDIPEDPRLLWDAFRVAPAPGSSIESGQLVVDKAKCWAPLRLGWWYAAHHRATFRWGYGDKHVCFQVPWAKLGRRYGSFADRGPWLMHSFLHTGPDGTPWFIHRCRDKFRFPGAGEWKSPQSFESNMFCRGQPFESEAFGWMADLAHALGVYRGTLNLGCGNRPLLGAHNHDRRKHAPFVATVHDLNLAPWPWPDAAFERVVADDVLEHLDDVVSFMDEAHRVLRPSGVLRVRVPHYQSENAVIDPTHRRGFHPRSLDFFTHESYGVHSVYTDRRWRILRQWEEHIHNGPNLVWEMESLHPAGARR
jgi:hypothetical protein